jgi:hypothetical protein
MDADHVHQRRRIVDRLKFSALTPGTMEPKVTEWVEYPTGREFPLAS